MKTTDHGPRTTVGLRVMGMGTLALALALAPAAAQSKLDRTKQPAAGLTSE